MEQKKESQKITLQDLKPVRQVRGVKSLSNEKLYE